MAKKVKARKKTASPATAGAGAEGKRRGRRPNKWLEGFGPADLTSYRKSHSLSEAKLARYLGVTLTTVRNWLGGDNTPSEAKQKAIQDLLAKDYVAPAEGATKPRGRGRRPAPTSNGAEPHDGDGQPLRSSALAEVVAAYVRRLPPEQLMDLDQLERTIARIKKALSS